MDIMIHAALFMVGMLTLAGFACYICRGRPATFSLGKRRHRERRALQEIEWHLLTEAETTEGGHSRQTD
jgi:hypothetical protein